MSTYPEEFKALEEENKRLNKLIKSLEAGYEQIQKLNAGKDNDIDWLCEQVRKGKALTKLKEEPEQGEFTKNILASLERWDSDLSDARIKSIIAWLKEVCRRYDWLVKQNARLQAEIKNLKGE